MHLCSPNIAVCQVNYISYLNCYLSTVCKTSFATSLLQINSTQIRDILSGGIIIRIAYKTAFPFHCFLFSSSFSFLAPPFSPRGLKSWYPSFTNLSICRRNRRQKPWLKYIAARPGVYFWITWVIGRGKKFPCRVQQGGVIFREKFGHLPCCAKFVSEPNSKILLVTVVFELAAEPQQMMTVTLKSARTKKYFLNLFFKTVPGGNVFLNFC